jgi:hypothetical protein
MRILLSASLVAALAAGWEPTVLAQQSGSRSGAQDGTASGGGQSAQSGGQSKTTASLSPQGFSVVLVLGDIQGATAADDVPPAARKALADMREFLPFKSYKLLDAAWVMCCGQDSRSTLARPSGSTRGHGSVSQILRGPDDREYALQLDTARTENSRVFVKFTLTTTAPPAEPTAEATSAYMRNLSRRIEDNTDQLAYLRKVHEDAKKKFEAGVAPGNDIAKLELDIRRVEREIEDSKARLAEHRATGRSSNVTPTPRARSALIDTSFTMDVGETVVVGTSRLTGGSRALIALLTAVPPRGVVRKE